jgi:hypothetical protein
MADKARQRRAALAKELNVSRRTAANIIQARRARGDQAKPPEPEDAGHQPVFIAQRVPLSSATPAEEMAFLTRVRGELAIPLLSLTDVEYAAACQLAAKAQIEMVGDAATHAYARIPLRTYHVFVDTESRPVRFGVTSSNPPATGGFIVDSFEHPEAPDTELRAVAASRNGPLRMQYPNGELGEAFSADPAGLDEGLMLGDALLGASGANHRLVTSRGVTIRHWTAPVVDPESEGSDSSPDDGAGQLGEQMMAPFVREMERMRDAREERESFERFRASVHASDPWHAVRSVKDSLQDMVNPPYLRAMRELKEQFKPPMSLGGFKDAFKPVGLGGIKDELTGMASLKMKTLSGFEPLGGFKMPLNPMQQMATAFDSVKLAKNPFSDLGEAFAHPLKRR